MAWRGLFTFGVGPLSPDGPFEAFGQIQGGKAPLSDSAGWLVRSQRSWLLPSSLADSPPAHIWPTDKACSALSAGSARCSPARVTAVGACLEVFVPHTSWLGKPLPPKGSIRLPSEPGHTALSRPRKTDSSVFLRSAGISSRSPHLRLGAAAPKPPPVSAASNSRADSAFGLKSATPKALRAGSCGLPVRVPAGGPLSGPSDTP